MMLNQLILSLLLWIAVPETTYPPEHSIDPIIVAIDSGSSSDLARYFDASISLNINGQQGDFSKSQGVSHHISSHGGGDKNKLLFLKLYDPDFPNLIHFK